MLTPDISATSVIATYNASSQKLSLRGSAVSLKDSDNVLHNIFKGNNSNKAGSFSLDAFIDSSGAFQSGSFEIKGTLTKSSSAVTLLKGTLTEANTSVFSQGQLEFLATADPTSSLAHLFSSNVGGTGIKLANLNGGSFASFTPLVGFFSTGTADIGRPVPEPASLSIFASLLMICFGGRLRQSRLCFN